MSDDCHERVLHQMWRDAWASLSYRERECLKHWFHVGGQPDEGYLTREELARVFGVSVSHVRRIVMHAAKKFDVSRVLALVAANGRDDQ